MAQSTSTQLPQRNQQFQAYQRNHILDMSPMELVVKVSQKRPAASRSRGIPTLENEIVDDTNSAAIGHQSIHQVTSNEPGGTGD